MSAINWCSIDAAFRKGGLAMGLKELDRQGYVIKPKDAEQAPKKWDDYATLVLK